MKIAQKILIVSISLLFLASTARVQAAEHPKKKPVLKPQANCPMMGNNKINKKYFVDAGGYRFYMCCPGCTKKYQADPQGAVAKLKAIGQKPEIRLAVCPKCGDFKGTKKCCAPKAKKCASCGKNKGSVGCCKTLKPLKKGQDVLVCPKCGEQAGTKKCCAPKAEKCGKCGLVKGSLGCCKLGFLKPKKGEHGAEHKVKESYEYRDSGVKKSSGYREYGVKKSSGYSVKKSSEHEGHGEHK